LAESAAARHYPPKMAVQPLQPLVVINAVGLTPALAAMSPRIVAAAGAGATVRPMTPVVPAVTLPAQATMLTGKPVSEHGVVGNGWYRRELGEVRFWVQANSQLEAEPVYVTARRRATQLDDGFTAANCFWWFAAGAAVDWNITPKPHYGADGSKAFDVLTTPAGLAGKLKKQLGPFPFQAFWGPMAGLASSQWIAAASAAVMRECRPTLTLVYLPHLDYELQRRGPGKIGAAGLKGLVEELAGCIETVAAAAREAGARVMIVSEYGITDVSRAVLPNRALREAGLLGVRDGPFGEMLDPTASRAFAVCDHQIAHVYVNGADEAERGKALDAAAEALSGVQGIAEMLPRGAQERMGLGHARAGELVLLAERDAWFAYPYCVDDARAPDFARTVDIHRKPGYDPCELFFDPGLSAPKLRVMRKLLARKLGFRNLMDVVPLDPSLVGGSHGLLPERAENGPVMIAGPEVAGGSGPMQQTGVRDAILAGLGLGGAGGGDV
jgi:hypothetical protein